ncbi:hypothetical protein IMX26_05020 [Clostridium sp. 'deep sea']|uniref:hypothetical protein n=1 Tax=Clostridium sp. 'deep sea' TaxID=2779445 RepID=UPI00189684EA|nr:hypothetical protein [Clostridium sp. 'deep sea']QOR36176.1 hypothetical protein IMX26_05020 [Clostridium sp. 'deep sea']
MKIDKNQKVFYCDLYYHSIETIYKILESYGNVSISVNEAPLKSLQDFKSSNIDYIRKFKISSLQINIDLELLKGRLILTCNENSEDARQAYTKIETILKHNNKRFRTLFTVLNSVICIAIILKFFILGIPDQLSIFLFLAIYNCLVLTSAFLINRSVSLKISSNIYNIYRKHRASFIERNQDTIIIYFGLLLFALMVMYISDHS